MVDTHGGLPTRQAEMGILSFTEPSPDLHLDILMPRMLFLES